jgi:hypothetical protein
VGIDGEDCKGVASTIFEPLFGNSSCIALDNCWARPFVMDSGASRRTPDGPRTTGEDWERFLMASLCHQTWVCDHKT